MMNHKLTISRYAMAVLLILSSITIAVYQVIHIDDVAGGTRWYIAQAFMLAGSIFGLDYYVHLLSDKINGKNNILPKENGTNNILPKESTKGNQK